MLNKFKHFFYLLLACAIISSCTGDDGDPGPQGEQGLEGEKGDAGDTGAQGAAGNGSVTKLGFFEGTVSGKRKDGTAFSEAFKYEYSYDSMQAYYEVNGVKYLNATRYFSTMGGGLYLDMRLKEQEGVLIPQAISYSSYFKFVKEIDADNLFSLTARPFFESTEAFVRPINYELNSTTYHFSTSGPKGSPYYYSTTYNSVSAYNFYGYISNMNYNIYYSQATGDLIGVYNSSTAATITSGEVYDLYNKLKFKDNVTLGFPVFYDAVSGAGLHEEMPAVPADQLTITNYVRDATSGIITYDFEIKISGYISNVYYRINTTGNDLTIKGKFNSGGKVYKNTVNRERS